MTFSSTTYPPSDDDYIGNESCIDLQSENDIVNIDHNVLAPSNDKKIIQNKAKNRVFPPPIPFLAQTQNLASHMPYVLKRYYTNEGRLIIKEEKVKHHEYFRAHRENGRLTLQLVPLDQDDYDFMGTNEEEDDDEELISTPTGPCEEVNNVTIDQSVIFNEKEEEQENKDNTQKSVGVGDELVVENENEIVGGGNSRVNCLNCNSVISAPSGIFGVMPLHPIRTVRG